jgi:alpha-tubulin suppressor-like RCC1 family protein
MNQHSTLRHSFTRILLCMPVAGMLASPALAAGDAQTAPVRDGWGSAVAWGDNTYGQTTVPPDLGTVIQVAAGQFHTVALQSDGAVRAWGWNQYGQTTVPPDLGIVIQVAAGYGHTVALQSDGTVRAWGDNFFLQTTVPLEL